MLANDGLKSTRPNFFLSLRTRAWSKGWNWNWRKINFKKVLQMLLIVTVTYILLSSIVQISVAFWASILCLNATQPKMKIVGLWAWRTIKMNYDIIWNPILNSSTIQFFMSIQDLQKEIREEVKVITPESFIGSLGGSVGMFFGFSFTATILYMSKKIKVQYDRFRMK